MTAGQGSISFSPRQLPSGAPFAAGSAVNGLSVDPLGRIVLGDPIASTGPADLLDSRAIDFNDFTLAFLNAHLYVSGSNSGIGEEAVFEGFNPNLGVTTRSLFLDSPSGQYGFGAIDTGIRIGINQDGVLDILNPTLNQEFFNIDTFLSAPDVNVTLGDRNKGAFFSYAHVFGETWGSIGGEANGSGFFFHGDSGEFSLQSVGGNGFFQFFDPTIDLFFISQDFFAPTHQLEIDFANQNITLDTGSLVFGLNTSANWADLSGTGVAYSINAQPGVTGSFTAAGGETITVEGGIIIGITP